MSAPHVLVVEAVTAGFLGPSPGKSLVNEGKAMLESVCADLAGHGGRKVVTLCSNERSPSLLIENVSVIKTDDPFQTWNTLCQSAPIRFGPDVVGLVIAPETEGLLVELCRAARRYIRLANCTDAALLTCSDKLLTAQYLQQRHIATIPTAIVDWDTLPQLPCVVKPIDGAGSTLVMRIDSRDEWQHAQALYQSNGSNCQPIWQPFVSGESLSIAAVFHTDDQGHCSVRKWLPVVRQDLEDQRSFQYRGSSLPDELSPESDSAIQQLIEQVVTSNLGLHGYVGFDIVLDPQGKPWIVEINPRLTSSYTLYRHLAHRQLAIEEIVAAWFGA